VPDTGTVAQEVTAIRGNLTRHSSISGKQGTLGLGNFQQNRRHLQLLLLGFLAPETQLPSLSYFPQTES
jgi:hypothetical protein